MTLAIAPDILKLDWSEMPLVFTKKMERITTNLPEYCLFPYTETELAEFIGKHHAAGKRAIINGNGSKIAWGGLTQRVDAMISTSRLDRVVDYAIADLTITIEAGMTLGRLQRILQENQQYLPIDAAFPETATLGGIVATADAGSWRQRYGGVRDLLLGISFVRADGVIAKAGGKVVKNVAGYDLMKLLTGSYGSLGAISSMTFRVYPRPETSQTVLLTGDRASILLAQQKITNSVLTPTAADLLSPSLVKMLEIGKNFGLLIRFESILESVQAQSEKLTAIADNLSLTNTTFTNKIEAQLWQRLSNALHEGNFEQNIFCKFGILPSYGSEFLNLLENITEQQAIAQLHSKSGLGKIHFSGHDYLRQLKELRQFCQEHQGFFSVLDAPRQLKQSFEPWGYVGNALPIMQQIQRQFDPQNLFCGDRLLGQIRENFK